MSADLGNAVFELGGAALCLLNIRQLLKDQMLRGVHWGPPLFWTLWGAWNVYFYAHLEQWLSWTAGVLLFGTNLVWYSLFVWFTFLKPRSRLF